MTRQFNLADLFELVARTVPDRLALVAGDRRLTYGELDERTNRLARWLIEQGLEPGAKVAVYGWNSAEWVEAFIASFKARVVPVNVNYRYVAKELDYVLDDSDSELVIVDAEFAPLVESRRTLVMGAGYEAALASTSGAPLDIERSPDDRYVLYTGGTTGMPKGVIWRGEDIYFAALSGFTPTPIATPEEITQRVMPDDFVPASLVAAPLMHGAAQWGLMNILYMGGTVVLYTGRRFDGAEVWRICAAEGCLGISLVGDAMARPLADALAQGLEVDVSSVKMIGSGGAVLSPAVKEELRRLLPDVTINDAFGASELGAGGTNTGAEARRFTVTPELNVLDDELRPVTPGDGVVGRLARTGHIPLGYYKDDAKTAATFPTDASGTRWAVPGDFGTVESDGTIVLLGRGSQCINTGGEKVYPEEVEETLKRHPAVFDALVVGLPDERFGERIAAVVSLRESTDVTLEELSEHCRTEIAGYKVPRQLVVVDSVVRSPAGKADYRWAKETAAARS